MSLLHTAPTHTHNRTVQDSGYISKEVRHPFGFVVSDVTLSLRCLIDPRPAIFKNLMQLLGENVTNSYIEKLIEEVDKDGDGR